MKYAIVCCLIAFPPLAGAVVPLLITDVNPMPERIGANPSNLLSVGGRLFFTGEDRVHGRELWVTDGTESGTRLVKDIRVGVPGSQPFKLQAVGERVFFFADDGEHGVRLWSSDGSDAVMTGEPSPGSFGLRPQAVKVAGSLLYYTDGPIAGSSSPFGWGLWRSDGTAAGTALLNPLEVAGFPPSRPFAGSALLSEMDGALFFANFGLELWRSTGTISETVKVADFGSGAQVVSLAGAAGRMWITLNRGNSKELWRWSVDGMEMKATIPEGALASDCLTVREGRAYFTAFFPGVGIELWTSDGTITQRVENAMGGPAPPSPNGLTWSGSTLYFMSNDGASGSGLWAADGMQARLVKSWSGGNEPAGQTVMGGVMYFMRNEGGEVLWRSDGTEAGTVPVKQVTTPGTAYGPRNLIAAGGVLYFSGNDGQAGFELWFSDGTPAGTGMLRDLQSTQDGLIEVEPGGVAAWGGNFVFRGNNGFSGDEPWRTDGTAAGTGMLADVWPGRESSEMSRFATAGGKLYFSADDGIHGQELWRSDAEGTAMVRDINPGSAGAYLGGLTALGDRLGFVAQDGTESGLWFTDGSSAFKVKGKAGVQLAPFHGGMWFAASDPAFGEEPWWTDGATTMLVKDIRPGSPGSAPSWFTAVGNEMFFQAHANEGFGLWRTDGTEPGTAQVGGWQGPGAIYPMVAANNCLFFFEENVKMGKRLWVVRNGQADFVKQIGTAGTNGEFPADPYVGACGGLLYFVADDGLHGRELWRSDGTPEGTVMVRDIRSGSIGSAPVNLRTVGGRVFFQANDGVSGEELWSTDGTSAGTRMVADIVPGSGGSSPGKVVLAGQRLFFSAVTEETGCEPWMLDVSAILDFHHWTETAGLSGIDAATDAVPHGDNMANLLKYAFGIDGSKSYRSASSGSPGSLPHFSVEADGDFKILKVTYVRRTGSLLSYTAKRSATLLEGSFQPMTGDESVAILGGGWERVERTERVVGERCFGVVEVVLPM